MALADRANIMRTEVELTLPRGSVAQGGTLHRKGVMRLATAFDEVQPLQDSRVQANQAYLSILLLSRVIVKLGTLSPAPPAVVEGLFSADFAYLQDLYVRLNEPGGTLAETRSPACGTQFTVDVAGG